VTRWRRSDFIAVTYAFDLMLANYGIAIAAKMPMITTMMRSSMSMKPLQIYLDPFKTALEPTTYAWAAKLFCGKMTPSCTNRAIRVIAMGS
jgi:hypothetical protein